MKQFTTQRNSFTKQQQAQQAQQHEWLSMDIFELTVLSSMHCRDCPVCKRRTFWMDLDTYSAMCTGNLWEAWIEESTVEPGKIDLGWPPTRFLKQAETIDDALSELRIIGAEIEAAGRTPDEAFTSIPEE